MQLDRIETNLRETIVGDAPLAEGLLANAARLDIHRVHFATTLTRALEATFPAVVSLVDQRFFAYCADAFIREHPPAVPCLFEYGSALPDFLASFPPCAALPYLPDIARLEWLVHEVFHAPDEPDGAIRTLTSPYPIHRIWRAALDPDAPAVDLNEGGVTLAIYRKDGDTTVEQIETLNSEGDTQ